MLIFFYRYSVMSGHHSKSVAAITPLMLCIHIPPTPGNVAVIFSDHSLQKSMLSFLINRLLAQNE